MKTNTVSEAIDRDRKHAQLSSDNRLAGALDVTKQALSKWRRTNSVPARRALQMEILSGGRVSWRDLCPDVVKEFEAR